MFDDLVKGGANLTNSLFGLGQYLISLFMNNPLWFLGGLVLLRVSQKGFKLNLSDLFGIKL